MTHNGVCLEEPAVSIQILSPVLISECKFFTSTLNFGTLHEQ